MKTFAFHSYKGGVGRTLALANFALALARNNKKVLMVDLDFDAPGLLQKFSQREVKIEKGYLSYLMVAATSEERARGTSRYDRIEILKDCMIEIQPNLTLLPAGDPGKESYWKMLASDGFHELFSVNLGTPKSSSSKHLGGAHLNRLAFQNDLADIAEAAGNPDFCLVDCKAAREVVSVPLFAWADHIVEFFHCNREGTFGVLMLQRLMALNASQDGGKERVLTPVVTRIPSGTGAEHIESMIRRFLVELAPTFVSGIRFPFERLRILYEQREIETNDLLVLDSMYPSQFSLSYNYSELFEVLEDDLPVVDRMEWKSALALNQAEEIFERYFRLISGSGELLNKDNKRNVALRKETLLALINSLSADQEVAMAYAGIPPERRREEISSAFESAGFRAGENFGLEATTTVEVWDDRRFPLSVNERLSQWCKFDREAGFGDLFATYDEGKREGIVTVRNFFLMGANSDLGKSFMVGYTRGVLSYLIKGIDQPVGIELLNDKSTAAVIEISFRSSDIYS